MAFLLGDGFDPYASVNDVAFRWASVGTAQSTLLSSANTAFSVGQGLSCNFNLSPWLAAAWVTGTNETTIYGSIRYKSASTTSSAAAYLALQPKDGTTPQVSILLKGDGSIEVRSGSATGTLLGSVAAGTFALNSWNSFQFKCVIDATVGSVNVRMNGSTSDLIALTNVNTRGGTTNAYANGVQLLTTNPVSTHQIDDVFFNSGSGAAPNTWPGDPRSVQQVPASTTQGQFAAGPSPYVQTITSGGANTFAPGAGGVWTVPFTAAVNGTLGSVTIGVNANATGNLKAAIYAADRATVLGGSTALANPVAGNNTVTFGTPVSLTKGTTYYLAVDSDVSVTYTYNFAGTSYVGTTAYASFPASSPSLSATTGTFNSTLRITPTSNADMVCDTIEDGDATYVFSATVGQEDIYTLGSLTVAPAAILGVTYYQVERKSDSGGRTSGLQLQANGSADTTISSGTPALSYGMRASFQPLDPTGAAWTVTTVNGAKTGCKVIA